MERAKLFISWSDFTALMEKLEYSIREWGISFTTIIALYRGGLVPATWLSHHLKIKEIICVRAFSPINMQKNTVPLIVDDIWDSGVTLSNISCVVRQKCPNFIGVAVLHERILEGKLQICSDFSTSAVRLIDDSYIVYPWETPNEEPIANYLKSNA